MHLVICKNIITFNIWHFGHSKSIKKMYSLHLFSHHNPNSPLKVPNALNLGKRQNTINSIDAKNLGKKKYWPAQPTS